MKKLHLILGSVTLFLLFLTSRRMSEQSFAFPEVVSLARQKAAQSYQVPPDDLPAPLKKLNYDQNRDIRWRDGQTLWQKEGLPFQVKFFHRTGWQPGRVDISEIADKKIRRLAYSADQFDFGKNQLVSYPDSDIGYAGFRVHFPLNRKDYLDEAFVFLGGSYFRAVAKNQQYGMSARAVAVNCGMIGTPEEFPRFTRFWIQRPDRSSTQVKILALLEGPSLSGAYEFTVTPGEDTRMDVKATLFIRKKIARLGLAPLTSMYWFGENYRLDVQDVRPEVHDSDGLMINNSAGEWVWRPLSNARHQRENFFADKEPSSFGLVQRDRYFASYEDLESHYESRPSSWVEPSKSMGPGEVALVQLPTNKETDDNVVAYWWSGKPVEAGTTLNVSYTLHWYGVQRGRPALAECSQTRIHYPVGNEPVHFSIDFQGEGIENIPLENPPGVELSASNGAVTANVQAVPNEYTKGWRVTFDLPSLPKGKAVDLRCRLLGGDKALTETWTYTWEPKP